ncbi:hypothetical protein GCM10011491_11920 [Brucella endophytica]|uniref:DUF1640 domain-containing protein n=1 Tax=Brucella endophytica TaxID=1963359 RepID=A0A916WCL3_9HYPH|nr:hypothetical protein [Brucella endophytica]GGA85906.1 hypothetical protein GCM10011491_11920 [Brucella endophytica]
MNAMSGNLYRALKSANVSDDLAQKAAEELVNYDQQLVDIRLDLAAIKAEQMVQRWMLGVVVAGVIALILRSFF